MKPPTKDTLRKFGRGLGFAAIAGVLTFLTDNQADLNIPAEFSPFYVAAVALVWRWVRDARGAGPVVGAGDGDE